MTELNPDSINIFYDNIDYNLFHKFEHKLDNIARKNIMNTEKYIKKHTFRVNDKNDKHSPYRWFNPKFKEVYYKEAKERNIDPDQAWDNVKWVDIEVEQDFLEKARAIFNDFVVDTRIQVPIDLEDDVLLKLFMEAHKRDITLNQLIEEILVNLIESHNSETTKEIISNLNY
jgi:hypothetical protein